MPDKKDQTIHLRIYIRSVFMEEFEKWNKDTHPSDFMRSVNHRLEGEVSRVAQEVLNEAITTAAKLLKEQEKNAN